VSRFPCPLSRLNGRIEKQLRKKEYQCSGKERCRQRPSPLSLQFRYEIRGGDIDGHPCRDRQPVLDEYAYVIGRENADECRKTQECCCSDSAASCSAASDHNAGDRHAFRELVQEDREENHQAKLRTNQKGARDRHAIKERMQQQTYQRGCARDRANRVGLFPKVKMGSQRMLSEVYSQVTSQDPNGSDAPTPRESLGQKFDYRDGQHEARPEGEKMFDDFELRGCPTGHGKCPQNIAGGRNEREEQSVRHERASIRGYSGWDPRAPRRAGERVLLPHQGQGERLQR